MATQNKDYGDQGAKRGVTGEKMDESLEKDFDTGDKGGEIGREWDESDQGDGSEPVIHVEVDDQGNLTEDEEE